MPTIIKKSLPGIEGEFTIKFSTRTYRFEIEVPLAVRLKIGGSWIANSWPEVEKELLKIQQMFIREEKFIRKVLIIQLRTSESNFKTEQNEFSLRNDKKTNLKLTHDKLRGAEGFQIIWHVAEEFQYPREKRYAIVESNKNFENRSSEKFYTIYDTMFSESYGEVRLLNYSEDLHIFLKSLDSNIAEMVSKLVAYFDIDENKFLENFKNTQLKLT